MKSAKIEPKAMVEKAKLKGEEELRQAKDEAAAMVEEASKKVNETAEELKAAKENAGRADRKSKGKGTR